MQPTLVINLKDNGKFILYITTADSYSGGGRILRYQDEDSLAYEDVKAWTSSDGSDVEEDVGATPGEWYQVTQHGHDPSARVPVVQVTVDGGPNS